MTLSICPNSQRSSAHKTQSIRWLTSPSAPSSGTHRAKAAACLFPARRHAPGRAQLPPYSQRHACHKVVAMGTLNKHTGPRTCWPHLQNFMRGFERTVFSKKKKKKPQKPSLCSLSAIGISEPRSRDNASPASLGRTLRAA